MTTKYASKDDYCASDLTIDDIDVAALQWHDATGVDSPDVQNTIIVIRLADDDSLLVVTWGSYYDDYYAADVWAWYDGCGDYCDADDVAQWAYAVAK